MGLIYSIPVFQYCRALVIRRDLLSVAMLGELKSLRNNNLANRVLPSGKLTTLSLG